MTDRRQQAPRIPRVRPCAMIVACVVMAGSVAVPVPVAAQAPAAQAGSGVTTTGAVRNWTRVESWRFFDPAPGGGNPDYTFIANRLQAGARHVRPRWEVGGALQYVQFGGLPRDAMGPGALGTGALYFDAAGSSRSRQVYLKALHLRARPADGVTLTVGRIPYTSGAEHPSGVPAIEAVKRLRLDSRLIGEFEWSIYQRAFDGVRVDLDRPAWRLTAAALLPTQGGFEHAANLTMTEVRVGTATLGIRPAAIGGRTELQMFGTWYDDRRRVTARPDNTGQTAGRADIGVATAGASLVGVYPAGPGEADLLVWGAGQTGRWYELDHRAGAFALEGGYRWVAAPWAPWLRTGVAYASGDGDPADDRHGTFFQMLPTARRYALSATYTQMNLRDVFAQVLVRPRAPLTARLDLRRLDLAQAADRWYAGSGATARRGAFFGYAGRPSGGHTSLGTVIEGAGDLAITRHWSINAYVGRVAGGDVVRALFAGDRLTFFYVEQVVGF